LPPNTQIDDAVQAELGEKELAFMDKEPSFDDVVANSLDDFVERHDHRLKVRRKEPQGEIGGGFQAGYTDALAFEFVGFHGCRRNDDWAITLAKARAAVEQEVFVAEKGVSGEAKGCHVIGFRQCGFIERLNVGKHVGVLVTWGGQFVSGQRIEHKSVVGIRRMGELDLPRLPLGLRCHLSYGHEAFCSFARPG